jgi:hypothetical protein
MQVVNPKVCFGRPQLDFGQGFYLTNSRKQAENWAKRQTFRLSAGIPTLNVYQLPDETLKSNDFSIKEFDKADETWLDFVIANRNETLTNVQYDMVMGPIADDNVMRTIRLYMNGTYDKQEALKRFATEKLDNQILITSEKLLKLLVFEKAIIL